MLKFAFVWLKAAEQNAANLICVPYSEFNSAIHNFYTITEIPDPDIEEVCQ